MNLNNLVENRKQKNSEIRKMVQKSKDKCAFFFQNDYIYNNEKAVEELGVDAELIDQLLEDFVTQILSSNLSFRTFLSTLKEEEKNLQELDYVPFKELVHKNLGVARNLRIKDAQEILELLMKKENLDDLSILLDILEACAIKLKPMKSYETLQILKLKN